MITFQFSVKSLMRNHHFKIIGCMRVSFGFVGACHAYNIVPVIMCSYDHMII